MPEKCPRLSSKSELRGKPSLWKPGHSLGRRAGRAAWVLRVGIFYWHLLGGILGEIGGIWPPTLGDVKGDVFSPPDDVN